jgi:hypothetical protein
MSDGAPHEKGIEKYFSKDIQYLLKPDQNDTESGHINRVDIPFDIIHTFNFFPTKQSNDEIKLKEVAEAKINAFLTLLGGDAELLTEVEHISSHELFDRLTSKKTLEGEEGAEDSELKYLNVIKEIREKERDLFEKIKRLPKKARTAKVTQASSLSGQLNKHSRMPVIRERSSPTFAMGNYRSFYGKG